MDFDFVSHPLFLGLLCVLLALAVSYGLFSLITAVWPKPKQPTNPPSNPPTNPPTNPPSNPPTNPPGGAPIGSLPYQPTDGGMGTQPYQPTQPVPPTDGGMGTQPYQPTQPGQTYRNYDPSYTIVDARDQIYGHWTAPVSGVLSTITIYASGWLGAGANHTGSGVVWVIKPDNTETAYGRILSTTSANADGKMFDVSGQNIRMNAGDRLQIQWTTQAATRPFKVLAKDNKMGFDLTMRT